MKKPAFEQGLGMPQVISIIGTALVLVTIFYYVGQQRSDESKNLQEGAQIVDEEVSIIDKKDGVMTDKYSGTILAGNSSPLLDFIKGDYDEALKTDKLLILYFYANWCPICKEEFPLMRNSFDELMIDNVIGFRVNYKDDETDSDEENLARQFGVAYQHTKVFVKNGERIFKSPEGWDKDRYMHEINKVLNQ